MGFTLTRFMTRMLQHATSSPEYEMQAGISPNCRMSEDTISSLFIGNCWPESNLVSSNGCGFSRVRPMCFVKSTISYFGPLNISIRIRQFILFYCIHKSRKFSAHIRHHLFIKKIRLSFLNFFLPKIYL